MPGLAGGLVFTGIIEERGKVLENLKRDNANRLVIASGFTQVHAGESIAVNGVCLTVLPSRSGHLEFDVSPETLNVTTLEGLVPGDGVNLERAMTASTRFGGHYVSGHVDAIAQVKSITKIDGFIELELSGFNVQSMLYLVPKGSITVEGVSLTINAIFDHCVKLMLIPHTLLLTSLGALKIGQNVNIEFDYLTRVVAHQLQISGKLNYEVKL